MRKMRPEKIEQEAQHDAYVGTFMLALPARVSA